MHIGPRSEVHTSTPDRPGHGTSQTWTRQINGTPYSFTRVVFLSGPIAGEIRWTVSRLTGDTSGPIFGHQWKPAHSYITFHQGGTPNGPAPALVASVVTPRMRRQAWEAARDLAGFERQATAHWSYVSALSAKSGHPYLTREAESAKLSALSAYEAAQSALSQARAITPHADYPHEAGTLYDCPRCEAECPWAGPPADCACVYHEGQREAAQEAAQHASEAALEAALSAGEQWRAAQDAGATRQAPPTAAELTAMIDTMGPWQDRTPPQ